MGKETIRTYETRSHVEPTIDEALHASALHFAYVQHRLFADIASGKEPHQLKNNYLIRYQITARQFNALKSLVEGKIDSIKKRRATLIIEKKERIDSLEKKIKKLKKRKADPKLIHLKKRRLDKLQKEHHHLKADQATSTIRLCFGSKKLFHAQFALEANNYAHHDDWLKDWKKARSRELFFLGSKDETSGNQSCTATIEKDQTISLRIRLPDALKQQYGKYIIIKNLTFNYGGEHILTALQTKGQAISWRMVHDKKGWRIFASLNIQPTPHTSNKNLGAIGLDINADHLAIVETDHFGNPTLKQTIPIHLNGKNTHQARAIIGDAAAQAIAYAEKKHKPLVVEDLDFQKKKTTLREEHTKTNARKLSSFSYQTIITHLKSNACKKGVLVAQVNPAYTSLIGRTKFAKRYGLTIHQAAALTIGRRYFEYSEKVPSSLGKIPDGKDGHVTLTLPARNRDKHVWTFWSQLNKELSAALKAQFRTAKSRSSSTVKTACETKLPKFAGAIPVRESSELLFC